MSRLIIKNLPSYVTPVRLREHFEQKGSPGGTLTDVKVALQQNGTSRRFGFVGFKTDEEAAAARKWFDRTFLDSTRISVTVVEVRMSIFYTDRTQLTRLCRVLRMLQHLGPIRDHVWVLLPLMLFTRIVRMLYQRPRLKSDPNPERMKSWINSCRSCNHGRSLARHGQTSRIPSRQRHLRRMQMRHHLLMKKHNLQRRGMRASLILTG